MKEADKKNVSSSELAKFLLAVIGILVALVLMYTLGTYVAHRYKSSREMEILEEYGYVNPVSVGDHCLNVAVFGNPDGKHTIVALSGLWIFP